MTTKDRIMIIDDSVTVQNSTAAYFDGLDVDVFCASSGPEGLELMKSNQPDQFAVVLCDYNMPGWTGIDTSDAFHREFGDKCPPFIMLTTEAAKHVVQEAKSHGVNGWIVKPLSKEAVCQIHKKFVLNN